MRPEKNGVTGEIKRVADGLWYLQFGLLLVVFLYSFVTLLNLYGEAMFGEADGLTEWVLLAGVLSLLLFFVSIAYSAIGIALVGIVLFPGKRLVAAVLFVFVPLLNLLPVLFADYAVKFLNEKGVNVGFFGVTVS